MQCGSVGLQPTAHHASHGGEPTYQERLRLHGLQDQKVQAPPREPGPDLAPGGVCSEVAGPGGIKHLAEAQGGCLTAVCVPVTQEPSVGPEASALGRPVAQSLDQEEGTQGAGGREGRSDGQ